MKTVWLFLFIVACGPSSPNLKQPTQYVMLDDTFRVAEVAALEAYNEAYPGLYHWGNEGPGDGETVVRFEPNTTIWPPEGGTAATDKGVIYLYGTMNPKWEHLPIVIVHELGHARGLWHVCNPADVMYYITNARPHTLESAVSDVLGHLERGDAFGPCQ